MNGKLSNKEHLNDNELDKWMDKVYGKFANVRVERNDGRWIEYTDDGKKFVVTKKSDKKGIKESRMGPLERYLTTKIDEGSGTDLDDKIYRLLIQLPEFKKLPMDKQGTITMKIHKMIK